MLAPLDLRLLQTFIVLVQTGSFSETSRRLGRTQPAVSLQLNRLEEATGAPLFTKVSRRLVLTNHGELVLGYARTIMGLQDELRARLAAPKLDGVVVLGMPDLYAAYLLPGILAEFRTAYPNVDVELKCALSSKLMASVERAEIDLAIVTGMPAFKVGELVAQETLVWVAAERGSVHLDNPVPLAMLPPGNIFRDFGLAALESIGRTWRLSCISESISAFRPQCSPALPSAWLERAQFCRECACWAAATHFRRCRRSIWCCIARHEARTRRHRPWRA